MKSLNITALIFWVFCGLIGYLVGGVNGALIGVSAASGLSLLAELL